MTLHSKRKIHKRISTFVDWVKPEESTKETIRTQSTEIRGRIKGQAAKDGLKITSTPNSGSFAKNSGLRRHYLGKSFVDGQDVDLPFVVKPETEDGKKLDKLIDKFYEYADATYPSTDKKKTKSSVQLNFSGTNLSYDIVPMLATDDLDRQILIRSTGEEIETSVQKHIEFIKGRTRSSNAEAGRVKFNECLRLLKWWREFRVDESTVIDEVPSIVMDLLCAKAYDEEGVAYCYDETLARWFGWIARAVKKRTAIQFQDYNSTNGSHEGADWIIEDPVNSDNNVAGKFKSWEIDELADWFEEARDTIHRAIRYDRQGNDVESKKELIALFGNPFKHHCEEEE